MQGWLARVEDHNHSTPLPQWCQDSRCSDIFQVIGVIAASGIANEGGNAPDDDDWIEEKLWFIEERSGFLVRGENSRNIVSVESRTREYRGKSCCVLQNRRLYFLQTRRAELVSLEGWMGVWGMKPTPPPLPPVHLILLRASRFFFPNPAGRSPLMRSILIVATNMIAPADGPILIYADSLSHVNNVSYQSWHNRHMLSLRHHTRLSKSMSRRNVGRPLILLFLLSQALAIIASAIPPKTPVSLLNSTAIPAASTPLKSLTSHNVTSHEMTSVMMEYHIVGTPLVLRITETGISFTERAVNEIIDSSIRLVVQKIITGSGNEQIEVRTSLAYHTFVQATRERRDIVSGLPCSPWRQSAELEKYNSRAGSRSSGQRSIYA